MTFESVLGEFSWAGKEQAESLKQKIKEEKEEKKNAPQPRRSADYVSITADKR